VESGVDLVLDEVEKRRLFRDEKKDKIEERDDDFVKHNDESRIDDLFPNEELVIFDWQLAKNIKMRWQQEQIKQGRNVQKDVGWPLVSCKVLQDEIQRFQADHDQCDSQTSFRKPSSITVRVLVANEAVVAVLGWIQHGLPLIVD